MAAKREAGPQERLLVLASTYPRWPNDTLPPFVHELARRLTAKYQVHVLVPHAADAMTEERMDGVIIHRFRYLPARFETLAYAGGMLPGLRRRPWRLFALPLFILSELIATIRLLRRDRYQAVHAHWLLPQGLVAVIARALCGYRPRIMCTAHGADVYGLNGALVRHLKRYTLRCSDCITVVSRAMLETLTEGLESDTRYHVLPMGVDTRERFTPGGAPPDPHSLLFVGRLEDKKGVHVLLQALALLPPSSDALLRIVGSGPEEERLRMLAQTLGVAARVIFVGPVPNQDLADWYRSSCILVFPSVITPYGDREGFGLVPAEALACGCAVVASDLPAVRDVIRHGETGLMVEPGNPKALAVALHTLLEHESERRRLARTGCEYVRSNFDWTHIAAEYAALLHPQISDA